MYRVKESEKVLVAISVSVAGKKMEEGT